MVYMYHSFLIHSSADGHPGCFHVLAIINSAVMNIGMHVSLSILVSSSTHFKEGASTVRVLSVSLDTSAKTRPLELKYFSILNIYLFGCARSELW